MCFLLEGMFQYDRKEICTTAHEPNVQEHLPSVVGSMHTL